MSSYIKQIQTTLKQAGFYKGEIDGIAGRMTVQAVNFAMQNRASGFVLGERSLKNLQGVHPDLVKVVKLAIKISPVDFSVIEGVRTKERQRELVKKGASKTMNSRHLTGHAVDIVPIVGGKISWNFDDYYPLAKAMAQASGELGVNVRWGGAWTVITGKSGTPQEWVKAYRTGGGRFLDGVHFELPA